MNANVGNQRRVAWIAAGFALALVAGFSFDALVPTAGAEETQMPVNPGSSAGSSGRAVSYSLVDDEAVLWAYQQAFRNVAQATLPVVVRIDTVDIETIQTQPFQFFFFGQRQNIQPEEREYRREGLGSGVLVRRAGDRVYVLTNNHVVTSADEIMVTLHDGREFEGTVVGTDRNRDLALVVFETSENVPLAVLGDSNDVQVGDWAFAVGNPLGFESTVTAGIISAVGRRPDRSANVSQLTDYLQTDAAINQGNSGGALVNLAGEVIGINTWIASQSGGNVGLGFAIPINNAKRAIEELISYGHVEYGWLGVVDGGPIADDIADSLGLQDSSGAFVGSVAEDSPADSAGLQPGDVILQVDGEEIDDWSSLSATVAALPPGSRVAFSIWRDGRTLVLRPRLGSRDDMDESGAIWPGLNVQPITTSIRRSLGLGNVRGVIVGEVYANSPAAEAGLRTTDIILEVNDDPIDSLAEFYRAVNGRSDDDLVFRVWRQGREYVFGIVR
jgi:Do/DeqQ family serine protease